MTPETILPWVSALLQGRWHEARRQYIESHPDIENWPKRRSRKRKPIPGLYEIVEELDG
jgi:hypothetical protein